eukprot:5612879-Pyramimonas_sp.AAC.1
MDRNLSGDREACVRLVKRLERWERRGGALRRRSAPPSFAHRKCVGSRGWRWTPAAAIVGFATRVGWNCLPPSPLA